MTSYCASLRNPKKSRVRKILLKPFIFLFVLLFSISALASGGHKKAHVIVKKVNDEQPVDVLLHELENIHLTLDNIHALSDQGFNTIDIEKELPDVEKSLSFIKDKISSKLGLTDINNFQMYDVMLDDILQKLDAWKSRLLENDKELVKLNAEMKSFTTAQDSVLKTRAIDSNYQSLIKNEIKSINAKWQKTSALSKADFQKIRKLQTSVSAAWFTATELSDQVVSVSDHVWKHVVQREYASIWKSQKSAIVNQHETQQTYFQDQWKVMEYYLMRHIETYILLFLFVCGFFAWTSYNFFHLKRLANNIQSIKRLRFITLYPVATSLAIFFIMMPFVDLNTPALFQGLMQAVTTLVLIVIFKKVLITRIYRLWVLYGVLFIVYFMLSNLFSYHLFIRFVLLCVAAAMCLLGIYLLKVIKGGHTDTLFLRWAIIISSTLTGGSVLLNMFGWLTFSIQLGLTGSYGLLEAFALRSVVQILDDSLLLVALKRGYVLGLAKPLHNRNFRKSLIKCMIFLMLLAWVISFADNLNVFDYMLTEITDFLNNVWHIGNTEFTPGNLLLFFFILYISSLLQHFTGYFFGQENDAGNPEYKRRGSMLAVIRLVLLIMGFLLAVAASGLPLDKITILLGALGVGIGLGLQSIVHNLVSGIILIFERPFQIGDLVEIGTRKGRVKDIGIRSSKLITTEGSEVIVPNGDLLSERVVNWTYSNNNVRVELLVKLASGSDIELAKTIISEELDKQSILLKKIHPEIFLNNITETGIELRVLAWIMDVHEEQTFRSDILIILFSSLKEKGIQMV